MRAHAKTDRQETRPYGIHGVQHWEKRRSEPSISQLKNLSAVFGVSVDFLIGNAEEC